MSSHDGNRPLSPSQNSSPPLSQANSGTSSGDSTVPRGANIRRPFSRTSIASHGRLDSVQQLDPTTMGELCLALDLGCRNNSWSVRQGCARAQNMLTFVCHLVTRRFNWHCRRLLWAVSSIFDVLDEWGIGCILASRLDGLQ